MATELTIWFSENDNYDDFEEGIKDADSFALVVPSTNEIRWIESLESPLLGTSGDEWKIGSNNVDTPITPTNFTVKQQTNYGSKDIQAIKAGRVILFVDFVGRKVRELTFGDDKYVAIDLTALAEHITLSGITNISLQKNPDTILWCVLTDGSLVGMVYEREQNVVAWFKIPIDGLVQSVCVVPGEDEDEVWISIFRTIIGEILYYEDEALLYEDDPVTLVNYCIYIEKFASRIQPALIEDEFFVDSGITFTSTTPTTTVTGLTHLIGETVAVLADGIVQTSKIVDENGEIELDTAASKVQVGLPYISKLEPMRPVVNTQMGSSAASIVSVKEMGISFLNSANVKYGTSDDNLFDINFDDARWTNTSEIAGLFTGTVVVSIDGGFSLDNPLIISSDSPLPATIRCLIPRIEIVSR